MLVSLVGNDFAYWANKICGVDNDITMFVHRKQNESLNNPKPCNIEYIIQWIRKG